MNGYLPDLEFEDNINPISLNLERLLIGYERNQLITMDPIVFLPEGELLVEMFLKSRPRFKKIKKLDMSV